MRVDLVYRTTPNSRNWNLFSGSYSKTLRFEPGTLKFSRHFEKPPPPVKREPNESRALIFAGREGPVERNPKTRDSGSWPRIRARYEVGPENAPGPPDRERASRDAPEIRLG
ncbi:hypothetical protein TNCT_61671 [Trichonephila clavata]|uniref:Uncharacterized protein n=1 Tax=Trichonephila clavata TaxID=2740835 RepID=A0A8X6GUF0_TRICU|nr:hypothetical protein TNCT_61671 [Trichonephila clavata]